MWGTPKGPSTTLPPLSAPLPRKGIGRTQSNNAIPLKRRLTEQTLRMARTQSRAFLDPARSPIARISTMRRAGTNEPSPRRILEADAMGHPDTSSRESLGWYLYDFANGAFFFSVLIFLPILITKQAAATAQHNYCGECVNQEWAKDFDNLGRCLGVADECGGNGPKTNATCVDMGGRWSAEWKKEAIGVTYFGIPNIGYASVALASTSVSVVLQLITFLLTGSLADYGSLRKRLLLVFHFVGCCACVLVLASRDDGLFWFSCLMYIIGNVSFGSAVIFYNAYLPLLVGAHPSVRSLVRENASNEMIKSRVSLVSNDMSAKGFGLGFAGQTVVLMVNLALIAVLDNDKLAIRLNTGFAGVWAATFGTFSIMSLQERASPPLPPGQSVVALSVKRVKKTFSSAKQLPQMFTFLFAYFVYSDGTGTIGASAAIFAAVELKLSALQIMYGVLLVSFLSGLSCVLFMYLHTRFNIKPRTILLFNLVVLGLIPVYGMVALRCQWEFYVVTTVFGLMYGSEQTFTRAIFANTIPHGHESEYFALFEVTDKGTAWLGPLVVAVVFSATGSFRLAFLMLVAFFVVGILLLLMFDSEKCDKEREMFEMLEQKKLQDEEDGKEEEQQPHWGDLNKSLAEVREE